MPRRSLLALSLTLLHLHCSLAFVQPFWCGRGVVLPTASGTKTVRSFSTTWRSNRKPALGSGKGCRGGGGLNTEMSAYSEAVVLDVASMDPIDFASRWVMLDDVVMGGASSSRVSQADHGGTFSGSVTTRFNGGFCSARCLPASVQDLKDFDGLAVRVLCEQGMRYKLILRENTARGGVAWCYSFDTVPGEWVEIKAPFSDFIPTLRGSTVPTILPFDSSSLAAVQLMLSKFEYDGQLNPTFKEGPFALQFGPFRAYKA